MLRVQDKGIGFKPQIGIKHGHRGLANIERRATLLGANLDVQSSPDQGTCITLTVKTTHEQ